MGRTLSKNFCKVTILTFSRKIFARLSNLLWVTLIIQTSEKFLVTLTIWLTLSKYPIHIRLTYHAPRRPASPSESLPYITSATPRKICANYATMSRNLLFFLHFSSVLSSHFLCSYPLFALLQSINSPHFPLNFPHFLTLFIDNTLYLCYHSNR